MRRRVLALTLIILMTAGGKVLAQMSGVHCFLQGQFLEVGIEKNGALGVPGSPSSYHPRPGGAVTLCGTSSSRTLSSVYDWGHDGWSTGTPAFMGDYTTPGIPWEDWDIEVAGVSKGIASASLCTSFGGGGSLTGGITGYSATAGRLICNWDGTYNSGNLRIVKEYRIDTTKSALIVTVKLYNTGSSTTTGIYYMRTCDPDNTSSISGGGPTTVNLIAYQNDFYHRVDVCAKSSGSATVTGTPVTELNLGTKDCRAKALWYSNWFSGTTGCALSTIWAGGASCLGTSSMTLGSTTTNDWAIGLVFNLGSLASGDSTVFSYAYIYNYIAGIDEAFPEPTLTASGAVMDTIDTITFCGGAPSTIPLGVVDGDDRSWTWGSWTWAPATGLSTTTGISTSLNESAVTTTTTYTLTGTANNGSCRQRTILLTVMPVSTTPPTVHDTSFCLGASSAPIVGCVTSSAGSLLWYTTATGGTGSATPPTISTSSVGTTTVWVSQTSFGCESARVPIRVTIVALTGISGPSAVCLGQTITLTNSTAGGSWSTSSSSIVSVSGSGSSCTAYGASVGAATVTYTLSTGCYITASITVNAQPTAITGPTSVCVGSSISLGSTPTGGTWSVSNTTLASINSATGSLYGISVGTDTVTYTATTGCTITTVITINRLPGAITGTLSVCNGLSTTLGCTPAGGTWSSASSGIATVSTGGVVTGVSAATTTITYTITGGCNATATFTVNPSPGAITGPSAVCIGNTISLGNSASGGTWSVSNTSIASIHPSTGSLNGIASGTDTVTYTLPTGCIMTTTITVNPQPSAITGPSAVCTGYSVTLGSTPSGGTWTSASTAVASVNPATGSVFGTGAGTTNITYTLGGGCYVVASMTDNPNPSAITGPTAVCEAGSTITLTDATTGCTWSTSNASIASIDAAGLVTGVAAGTATISYTNSTTNCFITSTITVNPLPPAILGPSALCVSATITLTNTMTGGSWSTSDATIASVSTTGVVTGVSVGSVTITYTSAAGCIITKGVSVNGLPGTITGPAVVCEGSTVTVSNSVSGGTWTSSNTAIASANPSTGDITGVSGGSVTITYSLGTGCYATLAFGVDPLPMPISGAPDVCLTYSTAYSSTTTGGTWSSSNTSIATVSTTGMVTGVSPGVANITYTLPTGCYTSRSILVNALPTVITGANNVCVNSTTTLTDTVTGGTWTSSNPSVASVGLATGLVTGVLAGSCTITYTVGTGCYMTLAFTVNPLPAAIGGPTAVCEASQITVTNSTGSGAWSSSNPSVGTVDPATGVVTGVTGGSVFISYTLPTGCNVRTSITVNPLPAAISGPAAVCEGGSIITLTNSSTGGSWTTSNASVASIVSGSGLVTGVAAGTATITYTLSTTCLITRAMTVNPLPGATVTPLSDTVFCPGAFVIIAASTGTGYTYQWYNGGSPISGETNAIYTAYTNGNYSIGITNTFGCTSFSRSVTVSVSSVTATASASGATSFCAGGSVVLNAGTGAGYTYQWLRGGAPITGATNANYTAGTSGSYSVLVTNSTGCSLVSSSITVAVLAAPSGVVTLSGPTSFCAGGSLILTADSTSVTSYQWELGGSAIAGATNRTYTATTAGSYRVITSNTSGCSATSAATTVTVFALPSATITAAGPTTYCYGGSVTLSVPAVAGNAYQWFNSGSAITGATANTYLATGSCNITVRVTSSSGCINNSALMSIVEVSIPRIVPYSSTTFCWGGSALLGVSVSVSAGVTYQWQLGGVNISGATNSTLNAAASGSYTCIVSIASGSCVMATAPLTVTGLPMPNPVITWDGRNLRTGVAYLNYQWFKNHIPIVGATNFIYTPTDTGRFAVQVTDINGCQAVSPEFVLGSLDPTGVTNVEKRSVSIFPNPSMDIVHIVAPEKVTVILSAVDGRRILEQDDAHDIDVSSLSSGVYLLSVYDGEGVLLKVERLTKQ